jgi:hypothetical protein
LAGPTRPAGSPPAAIQSCPNESENPLSVVHLLNLDLDIIFVDTTSTDLG